MRLDIPTMILTGIAAGTCAVLLTLTLVLSTGAHWGEEATPHVQRCYDTMTDWMGAEEGSADDVRLDQLLDDERCFY